MGSLLTSLLNSASALQVFSQALDVTQNNVVNSSTPGYARQTPLLKALPFDVSVGLPGGVAGGPAQSTRNAFAEQAVRQQQSALAVADQQVSSLQPLQWQFSLTSQTGIASSLNGLFQSFSALSVSPNDAVARQTVLNRAQQLSQAFRSAATGLQTASTNVATDTKATIGRINDLSAQIAQLNSVPRNASGRPADAAADARLSLALEQLSQYGGITALQQPDGSVSVFLGEQTALVLGNQSFAIQGDFSTPQTAILSAQGKDITATIASGRLGGQIQTRNTTLPSYLADLNTLAQKVADQVNTTLGAGIDSSGAAPVSNLFTYDPVAGAAYTLAINPLTPDQIAAAVPGAPGGNGNALNLAALANAQTIGGYTFTQFYGNLAGRYGSDLAHATSNQATGQQLVTQSQSLRSQASGISLDREAARMVQFQKAFNATSKMITVLDQLTNTMINLIK